MNLPLGRWYAGVAFFIGLLGLVIVIWGQEATAEAQFGMTNTTGVDTDSDGYDDSALINQTIINDDRFNDSACAFNAFLYDSNNQLVAGYSDDEHTIMMLPAGTTSYKDIILGVPSTSPVGRYTATIFAFPCDQSDFSNQTAIDLYPRGRYSLVLTPISTTSVTLHPNQTEIFFFNVTNNGNNPDRIAFFAFSSLNWNISFGINSTELMQPGETCNLTICVTLPVIMNPDVEDEERIIATSTKNPAKNSTVILKTRSAAFRADFEIICSNPNQMADLGGAIYYPIKIVNHGEYTDRINLFLKTAESADWSFKLNGTQLITYPNSDSPVIFLDVHAPAAIPREMGITITVGARSEDGVTIRSVDINTTLSIPDLSFDGAIAIDRENIVAGEQVILSADIANIGTKAASNVHVVFYQSGNSVDSWYILYLAPGSTEGISKTIVAPPGSLGIRFVIDLENEVREWNRSNNQVEEIIEVMAPELLILDNDIKFSRERPNEGDTVIINATVHNIGDVDGINVTVQLLVDNATVQERLLEIIPGNGGAVYPVFCWTVVKGAHRIAIIVDPLNSIPELNEDNNMAVSSLYVNSLPISKLSAKSQASAGDNVVFSAANSSDEEGRVVRYRFSFGDGDDSGWTSIPNVTHTYNAPGKYNVSLIVMDDDGAMSTNSNATVLVQVYAGQQDWTGIGLVAAVLVILGVAFFATRGKKPSK